MLSRNAVDVTRVLVSKAAAQSRTTYEQLAHAIGWPHPTGRGLGAVLNEILHECKARSLPPLTLIVVAKGTRNPSAEALPHIHAALGPVDIRAKQDEVFAYDWATAFEDTVESLPRNGRAIWLTSFWGFAPDAWGCIGFATKSKRDYFLRKTSSGVLVAIYVTKGRGDPNLRGKIVGFLEVSHTEGHARDFISGDQWAAKEADPDSRGKWPYALKVTRAWRVVEEDMSRVDELLPQTYKQAHPEFIGAQGVPVRPEEQSRLLALTVYEVPVYGQADRIDSAIQSLDEVLNPSKAVHPASEPYWVGETDGPKHLYILRLTGDLQAYLGQPASDLDGKMIIKVGFSKSPSARRDQIQAAYPSGRYKWEIVYPKAVSEVAPYPNAEVAIAGEDAMKARLQTDGGKSLGGEFFLADEGLVIRTWAAGKYNAETAMERLGYRAASE